ncbi:MAG: hypothetical protein OK439_04585 [Thaumarchaeota archaeon]|nr:hypothetical protein [Nitrososphaerota archaeon]
MNFGRNVWILLRYWVKGRFSRTTLIAILLGEIAFSIFVLFAGSTFLSFSSRFGQGGAQITEVSWSLVLGFYLIGLVQSGFSGAGLPVSSADVDYVFTSPVKTSEMFAAKILLNSIAVLFSFPPIFLLYLRSTFFYGTPAVTAIAAGFITVVFFLMGLLLSADVTLALRANTGRRMTAVKYGFMGAILVLSLIPIALVIPGAQTSFLSNFIRLLPSGTVAEITVGLVGGLAISLERYIFDLSILSAWLVMLLFIGTRLSQRQFYELLQVTDSSQVDQSKDHVEVSKLNPQGRSVWSVVRTKERILMNRTKEGRGQVFSALILSVFLVVYALAGTFTSSPTSFLFILSIIGSFGSGNAMSWIEKERLWILKTSSISLRRYVKQVFIARVTPLLLYLTPAIAAVGALLIASNIGKPETLLGISLALSGSIQIAAITMGGSMYFASKFAQSSTDDIISLQAQDMTNIKRIVLQTVINLIMVGPLMVLVLAGGWLTGIFGVGSIIPIGVFLSMVGVSYTVLLLNVILNGAGDSINKREDL